MRKPTRKMIEALVALFGHNGGRAHLPAFRLGTVEGLIERELIECDMYDGARLTDTGLAFLVDTRRAVVTADGTWVCANREPMSTDQVTAELIRFESDRAIEAETLAKADAIRERRAAAEAESDRVHEDANRAWANGVRAEQFTPEFPPGVKLRNPATGTTFEVVEHTYAVRLRNVSTGTMSAIPQDMARELDRVTDDAPVIELSYRDQGLVEGTAAMLAEGRGSAIVNLADGGRAWTPVDRVGEFDRASRRAPDAAWEKATDGPSPQHAVMILASAHKPIAGTEMINELLDAGAMNTQPGREYLIKAIGDHLSATGFLPALNAALTPGEIELLDRVDASDVVYGTWVASTVFNALDSIEMLMSRGLAYRGSGELWRTLYLTTIGARLVKYRRAVAAAKDSATPERAQEHVRATLEQGVADALYAAGPATATGATSVTVEQVRDGMVVSSSTGDAAGPVSVAVDPGAYIAVRLTITRLRRGLTLSSADRVALADLLDTVRRALLPASDPNYNASWFDVSNTYRAHFGDTR